MFLYIVCFTSIYIHIFVQLSSYKAYFSVVQDVEITNIDYRYISCYRFRIDNAAKSLIQAKI